MRIKKHEPSYVLELPNSPRWELCLVCEKPWPCEKAGEIDE
jgi:hypothetical protein